MGRSIAGRAAVVCALAVFAGCSPSLHPLYRDYQVKSAETSVRERLEDALESQGWVITEGPAPNVVATERRQFRDWVIYRVVVELEAVPMGERHVRLFVHPYRIYVTGGRSKIPFLKRSLRRTVLRNLDLALGRERPRGSRHGHNEGRGTGA